MNFGKTPKFCAVYHCFLVLAKVCVAKDFYKKGSNVFIFCFYDNIFLGKNRYGTESVALIKKISFSEKSNKNRAFTFFCLA